MTVFGYDFSRNEDIVTSVFFGAIALIELVFFTLQIYLGDKPPDYDIASLFIRCSRADTSSNAVVPFAATNAAAVAAPAAQPPPPAPAAAAPPPPASARSQYVTVPGTITSLPAGGDGGVPSFANDQFAPPAAAGLLSRGAVPTAPAPAPAPIPVPVRASANLPVPAPEADGLSVTTTSYDLSLPPLRPRGPAPVPLLAVPPQPQPQQQHQPLESVLSGADSYLGDAASQVHSQFAQSIGGSVHPLDTEPHASPAPAPVPSLAPVSLPVASEHALPPASQPQTQPQAPAPPPPAPTAPAPPKSNTNGAVAIAVAPPPPPPPQPITADVRPRVEPYSLAWWLHRIGFAMAVTGLLNQIDPLGMYGLIPVPVAIVFFQLMFVCHQCAIVVWLQFTVAVLYRRMNRLQPAWMKYAILVIPLWYSAGYGFLYYVPRGVTGLAAWSTLGSLVGLVSTLSYAALAPWVYHRIHAVMRSYLAQRRAADHKYGAGGSNGAPSPKADESDTALITSSMASLRRFVIAVTVSSALYSLFYLVVSYIGIRDWVNEPNKPQPPPIEHMDSTSVFMETTTHVIGLLVVRASWIPFRPVTKSISPPAVQPMPVAAE